MAYLTGPPFAGYTFEHFGIETPFVAMSAAAVLVTAALLRTPAAQHVKREPQRLLPALRALQSTHVVRSALVLIALVGSVMGVVQLLVPLRLSGNGLSAGEIGAVFSASSAVWIAVSGFVARRGDRAVRLRVAGVGMLLLGGVFLLPLATLSTAAVVAFVLLRSGFGAPLSTIVYPLSEAGARSVDVGGGIVLGLMNAAWGGAAVLSPLVAGALAQTAGERWTFGVVVCACLAAGSSVLLADRRASRKRAAAA
jgi:predicted MFS family arabinose efflux permease